MAAATRKTGKPDDPTTPDVDESVEEVPEAEPETDYYRAGGHILTERGWVPEFLDVDGTDA